MEIEKVAQAMSWSVMAKVARFIAGFAATILIVRSFDEYDWGILTVLRSIIGFVTVVVLLGAGNALLKYIPMVRIKGGMGTLLTNFRKIFLIQFAVWLLLLILARLSGPILNSFFDKRFERFGFYLQFAVGFVIFDAFMTLITSILQSWYETRKLGIVIICGNGCYIALLVLFLKLDWGIVGVLAAGAMVSLGMSLLLLSHVRDVVKRSPIREGEAPGLEKIMRFSLPFVATGVLNQIVWRHSEVIFLSHFQGAEIAGYFGLAYKIPQLLLEYIPLTIWPIVMAGTSEVYARSSDNLPRAIDLYYRLLYILVIPVAAMGFAFARPFVPILFGSEMVPAAVLAQLFFVVFSYSFLYTPLSMALYVMEKSWVNMLVFTFLAVINVGLDLAIIPRYGIWGAFIPVAFVLMLGVVVFYVVLKRFRPDIGVPVSFILRCYIAAAPTMFLAITSIRWSSPLALGLQIPIGFVLLIIGFRWMKVIGEREIELIMKLPLPYKEKIITIFK